MNYEDFKATFMAALRDSRIPVMGSSNERLDLQHMDRTFEVFLQPLGDQDVEPFFVSGKVWWQWRALHTARTSTREEDMLNTLFGGGEDVFGMDTDKPSLRVDIQMQANLLWGHGMPLPKRTVWAKWAHEVHTRLEYIERVVQEETSRQIEDGRPEILAWRGDPEARVVVGAAGELTLEQVKVSAFQIIELPRIWDDPEREADAHPHAQLNAMFTRIRSSLHAWKECVDHLITKHSG